MKEKIVEKRYELDTTIDLPLIIVRHKFKDKYLFIAPEISSWLVLNAFEEEILNLLHSGKTLGQILDLNLNQKILINLLAQIEYKRFHQNTIPIERRNLYTATIYLTNACNLCCRHCYMLSGKPEKSEISIDKWKRIIDLLKSVGVKTITLTGGEPMCKKDFWEILDFIYTIGLNVVLLSNGTLINKSNYRYIAKRCVEIQISLDGPTAELHEKIRGIGSYQKTMDTIRLLSTVSKYLIIAMTPIPDTIDKFEEAFADFMMQIDAINKKNNIFLNLTPVLQKGRFVNEIDRFDDSYFYQKVKHIVDKFIEKDYFEKKDASSFVPGEKKYNCGFGESYTVWWDGSIRSCYKSAKLIKCPITAKELLTMINNQFEKSKVSLVEVCQNCDLRFLCGGSCRVRNQEERGGLLNGGCSKEYKQHLYDILIMYNELMFDVL